IGGSRQLELQPDKMSSRAAEDQVLLPHINFRVAKDLHRYVGEALHRPLKQFVHRPRRNRLRHSKLPLAWPIKYQRTNADTARSDPVNPETPGRFGIKVNTIIRVLTVIQKHRRCRGSTVLGRPEGYRRAMLLAPGRV